MSTPTPPQAPPAHPTHVAFLRGMNLGRRRLTNDALLDAFRTIGFEDATAYQAAGNVLFIAPSRSKPATLERRLAEGLEAELAYPVPVFVRSAKELHAIAGPSPLGVEVGADRGKVQVMLLRDAPDARAKRATLAMATDDDRLAFGPRELHWLPRGRLIDSTLDLAHIERLIGPTTTRTKGTIERIAPKLG